LSGEFLANAPNFSLQIIANTEVWDLRTFHLLQTVPVLDQRNCTFSPMHVIYGASLGADRDHDMDPTTYDTSFNVLDAYDYSSIATIDVKRNINDLSVSANGSLIAVVEDYSGYESKQETYVKIYAVGVKKSERSEEVRAVKELASEVSDAVAPAPANANDVGGASLLRVFEEASARPQPAENAAPAGLNEEEQLRRLSPALHASPNLSRQHAPNSSIVGVRRRARTLGGNGSGGGNGNLNLNGGGGVGIGAAIDLRTLMRRMDDIELNIMSMLAGR